MSIQQQRKAQVLSELDGGRISMDQACMLLSRSPRTVRRLLARYRAEGVACVVHGNTGRVPVNKTPQEVRQAIVELAGPDGTYHAFNACHLQELLEERHGIRIGRSTLDRLLAEERLRRRRRSRRSKRLHRWRERCACAGDMLLVDGSPFRWLGGRDGRGDPICLLGCMDDATGAVLHLRFWPTECQAGYITMLRDVAVKHGLPVRVYHDRHTILCSPRKPTIADELAGRKPMSQFEAILDELGIESIQAKTPQAKGRIERLWRTLQDRLVKELELAGIASMDEANMFLEEFVEDYNRRFSVSPQDPESAWVVEPDLDLPYYFAAREQRVVRSDHTFSWKGMCVQIDRQKGDRSLAGSSVNVHTTPEGEQFVYAGSERLSYKIVPERPITAQKAPLTAAPDSVQQSHAEKKKPSDNPRVRAWLFAKR